jgi:hypothetical protein
VIPQVPLRSSCGFLFRQMSPCPVSGNMAEAAQSCGGTAPPCCYNVDSTNVEGTASTCCARYRSRGVS